MDPECIDLCKAMNLYPGIQTEESCCGHGKDDGEYHIWFRAINFEALPNLLYWFMGCHTGFYHWYCKVRTDCAASPAFFCIVGPTGEAGYYESKKIAEYLKEDLE